jgi:DNA gyrase subunit A
MGRAAAGVYAMRLVEGDLITGADVVRPDCHLLLITEKGYGKRTKLDEFRRQGRYGKGVRAMFISDLTGKIVSARVVTNNDGVTFISTGGIILRTSVDLISIQSRHSRGVSVMDLKDSDVIVSVAIVREGYLSRVKDDDADEDEDSPSESIMAEDEISSPSED